MTEVYIACAECGGSGNIEAIAGDVYKCWNCAGEGCLPDEGVEFPDLDEERVPVSDQINHPTHYTFAKIEPIDVIEDWGLGFHLGNCVKYVARAPHKGSELADLKKARWYLDRLIGKLEAK